MYKSFIVYRSDYVDYVLISNFKLGIENVTSNECCTKIEFQFNLNDTKSTYCFNWTVVSMSEVGSVQERKDTKFSASSGQTNTF